MYDFTPNGINRNMFLSYCGVIYVRVSVHRSPKKMPFFDKFTEKLRVVRLSERNCREVYEISEKF